MDKLFSYFDGNKTKEVVEEDYEKGKNGEIVEDDGDYTVYVEEIGNPKSGFYEKTVV
jgi:hypothetical protein